jgi:hypothetical protein
MVRWRIIALLLPLAACSPDYPMDKPGTWAPPPVSNNDQNLKVMVVNPQDLVAGAGEDNSLGSEAGPPVHRLLTGRRTDLPPSNAAQFQFSSSPQTPAAPGGSGGTPGQ